MNLKNQIENVGCGRESKTLGIYVWGTLKKWNASHYGSRLQSKGSYRHRKRRHDEHVRMDAPQTKKIHPEVRARVEAFVHFAVPFLHTKWSRAITKYTITIFRLKHNSSDITFYDEVLSMKKNRKSAESSSNGWMCWRGSGGISQSRES